MRFSKQLAKVSMYMRSIWRCTYFGIVVGRRFISVYSGVAREIIQLGVDVLLIKPGYYAGFAETIARLESNSQRYNKCTVNGVDTVKRFSS